MKYLPFFGFVLIYGCCFALPQFPGISSMELLNAIENLDQRHYFSSEQVDVGANGGTAAGGATGCNYQDYSSKFTQWTSDAGLPQNINYTSNGQALKDAINAIFAAIDPSDKNAAQIKMDKFCISQRQFYQNLGVTQIAYCIYAAAFVSNGYDKVSAFQTTQILNLINYQCGPAFKTYTDNINTYLTAQTSQQTSLETCATQFINNLNSSASSDHGCPQMQTYEHCVGKIYNQATSSLELAWTVCEATRRVNVVTLPACRDSTYFCQLSMLT
jgi:hypothetical protein